MAALTGPKFAAAIPDDAMCAWLPGGRAVVVAPDRAPYIIEADGREREISFREAALHVTDPRALILPGSGRES